MDGRFFVEIALIGFLSLFALFMLLKSRRTALMLIVPLLAALLIDTWGTLEAITGTSSQRGLPTQEVQVLSTHSDRTWVYVWYMDPVTGAPRAIKAPLTEGNKKEVNRSGERTRVGQASFMKFQQNKKTGELELNEYAFSMQFHSRKDTLH